jgi:hypothetical protein
VKKMMRHGSAVTARASRSPLAAVVCALALFGAAQASAATQGGVAAPAPLAAASSTQPGSNANPSATLVQCATALIQTERSATFAGEMTAIPGGPRMAMRIEVQQRMPGEALFHAVVAPGLGLGVWRASAPGVKVYRYLKQVTNLSAPGFYRAAIRFRWMNARGRPIRGLERVTPHCLQPRPAALQGAASPPTGA